jgi:hypothetical protein
MSRSYHDTHISTHGLQFVSVVLVPTLVRLLPYVTGKV